MYYQVIVNFDHGQVVYASGEKDHCLDALDRAESHGYDAYLIGVPV